ncbi:hypothetical protein Goshw_029099 [Gossypium schwendimanii]|uniref:DUF7745 domain-containing protein n=1 Tax=Gossypium schwendimanii TaxID=34291 RepID=A0A7J9ML51_GOSSC|nr:hypothetical protein [Gossypium schwendimanii]
MTILQNLQDEVVEWRAPWMVPDEILYRCGDFDWVSLLEIWGAIGYTPLLVLRQYRSRQFILATQGLAECEFSYKGNNYKENIREMSSAWKQIHRVKRITVGATTTPEYHWWQSKRINDNIIRPIEECVRFIEEYLRVVPSELEIIKQDFDKRSLKFGKKIEQLEEEKMRLGLDEIKKEKTKADQWEKKFQDARARESALEKSLLEYQNKEARLKARVAELERVLHLYRSRNSMIKLRASLITGWGHDKGNSPVVNSGDDHEDHAYPPGSSSNPRDNPTNPVVPDLDDVAEIEKARVDLPKQLEDQCRCDKIEAEESTKRSAPRKKEH